MKFIKTFLFFIFLVSFANFADAASVTGDVNVIIGSVSVSAPALYTVFPSTPISANYTVTANTGPAECQLLDYNSNALTAYSTANPIIANAPPSLGSYVFYIRCRGTTYPDITGNSNQVIVNVIAPDLKITAWDGCRNSDGTYNSTCTARVFVWGGYDHVDGPVELAQDGLYQLSWGSTPTASSCKLDGVPVSTTGGLINTYTTSLLFKTHTLTCTNASGQTSSNVVTVKRPPMPTNLITSCSADGKTATIGWGNVPGYSSFYTRASQYGIQTVDRIVSANTDSFPVDPNVDYSAWIHTRATNGAWSNSVSVNGRCVGVSSLVSTSVGTGGSISPVSASVAYNTTKSFTITSNPGYLINSASGCNGSRSGSTYTTGAITSPCTVSVTFIQRTGTLTPTSPTCTIPPYGFSCNVTLTWSTLNPIGTSAITASGMTSVSGNSGSRSFLVPYQTRTFYLYNNGVQLATSIARASCALGYTFFPSDGCIPIPYLVSTSVGTGGSVSPVSTTVDYNNSLSIRIYPDSGYIIDTNTTYGCDGSLSGATYNTGSITSDCTVYVAFKKMTGSIAPLYPTCTIPLNGSSCNVTLTWSVTNPVGSSAVTASAVTKYGVNYPAVNVSGNSGSQSAYFTVPYSSSYSRIFYLYNNGIELGLAQATASCGPNYWNGTKCISPVNGGWSALWSTKSTACGFTGNITRLCNNPAPLYGGTQCTLTNGTLGLTETQPYTTAPCAPIVSGPTNTSVNARESFGFLTTNPNGHAIEYGVDWNADGYVDNWLPYDWSYVASGVSQSITQSSSTAGTFTFKALAQDKITGTNSAWSSHTVTVSAPVDGVWSDWDSPTTWCGYTGTLYRTCTPPSYGGKACSEIDGGNNSKEYTNPPCDPSISGLESYVNVSFNYEFLSNNQNQIPVRFAIDWNNDGVTDEWTPYSKNSQFFSQNWTTVGTHVFKALAQYEFSTEAWSEERYNSNWTTKTVTVKPTPAAPVVTVTASPSTVDYNGISTISYKATNAASVCNSLSYTEGQVKSFPTAPLKSRTTIKVSCSGPGGVGVGSVIVNVRDIKTKYSEQ